MAIIYFQSETGYAHQLSDDVPTQKRGVPMGKLGSFEPGDEVEVFIESGWVRGTIRSKPTSFKFVVDCISFEDEKAVWQALHKALSPFYGERHSVIPWLKIIPPSRQEP